MNEGRENMDIIDELRIIDGVFADGRFIMRGIAGHAVYDIYSTQGLRSMGRLILEGEPINIVIDKDKKIHVPLELNGQLKRELFMIADELEKGE